MGYERPSGPLPVAMRFPLAISVGQEIPRGALAIMRRVGETLGRDPRIIIYPADRDSGSIADPWICFDVGDREFGIWRRTLALYEADEHGAMGEDALDPATLEPEQVERSLFDRGNV